jgi:hypothetical protein
MQRLYRDRRSQGTCLSACAWILRRIRNLPAERAWVGLGERRSGTSAHYSVHWRGWRYKSTKVRASDIRVAHLWLACGSATSCTA